MPVLAGCDALLEAMLNPAIPVESVAEQRRDVGGERADLAPGGARDPARRPCPAGPGGRRCRRGCAAVGREAAGAGYEASSNQSSAWGGPRRREGRRGARQAKRREQGASGRGVDDDGDHAAPAAARARKHVGRHSRSTHGSRPPRWGHTAPMRRRARRRAQAPVQRGAPLRLLRPDDTRSCGRSP
jgi:hypothetical protein